MHATISAYLHTLNHVQTHTGRLHPMSDSPATDQPEPASELGLEEPTIHQEGKHRAPDVTVDVVRDEVVRASAMRDTRVYVPLLAAFVCILSCGASGYHVIRGNVPEGGEKCLAKTRLKTGRNLASTSSVRAASSCMDRTVSLAPNSRPKQQQRACAARWCGMQGQGTSSLPQGSGQ